MENSEIKELTATDGIQLTENGKQLTDKNGIPIQRLYTRKNKDSPWILKEEGPLGEDMSHKYFE